MNEIIILWKSNQIKSLGLGIALVNEWNYEFMKEDALQDVKMKERCYVNEERRIKGKRMN